jgi:acetoin utilization protein AcuB
MQEHGIRHLPILRDGTVVGMVSARDLKVLTALEPERRALVTAADIMTPDPVAVSASDWLDDVALLMSERKIGSVVVLDEDERFYGIFTATDALNALVEIARGAID